jgi:hypothetical protein
LPERRERSVRTSHPTPLSREARLAYCVRRPAAAASLKSSLRPPQASDLAAVPRRCPIVGDVRYGAPSALPSCPMLFRKAMPEHPTRSEVLAFTAPLPIGWPRPG